MDTPQSPIRLILVDDHPVVRSGYRRLLESTGDIEVVAEGADGAEAVKLFREHRPDIVVLDLAMRERGGMEALRLIRKEDPDARVLIFSVHDSGGMLGQAMKLGATGYLSKRADPDDMLDAVYAVAKGKMYVGSDMLPLALNLQYETRANPLSLLTPREIEVFRALAEGRSVGDIAAELKISPRTVGVHQTRIMQKLDLQNRTQLVRIAVQNGMLEL